jgi:hypothetical protein
MQNAVIFLNLAQGDAISGPKSFQLWGRIWGFGPLTQCLDFPPQSVNFPASVKKNRPGNYARPVRRLVRIRSTVEAARRKRGYFFLAFANG